MRKIFLCFLLAVIFLCAAGCNKKGSDNGYAVTKLNGVSMEIKEGSLNETGMTIVISDTNGRGKNIYGQWFVIEKKEKENWKEPNWNKNANRIWDDIGYLVNDNGILELDIGWEDIYGALGKGSYRLITKVYADDDASAPNQGKGDRYISVEFDLK